MRTTTKMGLASWDQPGDPYDYQQLAGNWQIVDFHDHSPGRGVQIGTAGLQPGSVTSNVLAAGAVGPSQLSSAVVQDLGLNSGGNSGRGAVSISGAQGYAATSYGTLATPDQVSITLQTNGIIAVLFEALWKVTSGTSSAGVFIGASQIQYITPNGVPVVAPATNTNTHLGELVTSQGILTNVPSGVSDSSDSAGPMWAGTPIFIRAAAGTYNVSIQFQQTGGGSMSVQNRHLNVWTVNFV